MNFYDKRSECREARPKFDKDKDGHDICIAQHTLLCNAGSCLSTHYWTHGKQKQIGWTSARALENTGLEDQYKEEME